MHTLWNESDRAALMGRLARLSPTSPAQWGKMNAPKMLTHVTDALRAALGELPVTTFAGPLQHWPLNMLVIYVLPWPKGAPTAPELMARTPEQWQAEVATLTAAIGRFAARTPDEPWVPHAAFGAIDGKAWGRLQYRHLDHHFRQFGV